METLEKPITAKKYVVFNAEPNGKAIGYVDTVEEAHQLMDSYYHIDELEGASRNYDYAENKATN